MVRAMLEKLKEQVYRANLRLAAEGLVMQTWGNVSGVDRAGGHVVIKPSGVPYEEMKPEHMVVVSLATGKVAEGDLRPSSDTPTHRVLYQAFADIGGLVHAHSLYATAWAQARREIPCFGTTHADYFYGPVPCTRPLRAEEIADDYEANTGRVIAERFHSLDPRQMPAVLVAEHGPFAWGAGPDEAVSAAVTLEQVSRLATETLRVEPYPRPISQGLLDKHYLRKHGPEAYYGQK
jgi:L-ribulose-5-phosphate 4-epimerase